MASRDRTKLYIQFRKNYEHELNSNDFGTSSRKKSRFGTDSYGKEDIGSELYELEEMGLILSDKKDNKNSRGKSKDGYHLLDVEAAVPRWVDIKDEVNEEIERIGVNFSTLETMHRKRLLPGFQDRSSEEKAIQDLTDTIFQQLKACHFLARQLGDENVAKDEPTIVKNAQVSIATRLQDLSSQLRLRQTSYLNKLKAREQKAIDIEKENQNSSNFEDQNHLLLVQETRGSWEEDIITQREHEIAAISESISQLADLFRSLQTMVIDQGTLMDRIDYNVESMATHMKDAVSELQTAVQYQRSGRSKYCIMILLVLIALMILLLIMKSIFKR